MKTKPTIKIISPEDSLEWNYFLNKLDFKDLFLTSEYFLLNSKHLNTPAELFIYQENENFVFYPYLKKSISRLNLFDNLEENYWDISTLEYGGPILSKQDLGIYKRFRKHFDEYCKKNNIVSEFIRYHPFYKNHVFSDSTINVKKIFYLDLNLPLNSIKSNFKKSNRNIINKSLRNNVKIKLSKSKEDIKKFHKLYIHNMQAKKARDFYFYSESFFNSIFDKFGENIKLFLAFYKNSIIGGSIFLFGDFLAQYYLSAINRNYSHLGPNNLILFNAISYAKDKNINFLNLGGGNFKGDGLAKFKNSFTKLDKVFYIDKVIHMPKIYDFLKKETLKRFNNVNKNFFPIYRGVNIK